MFQKSMTVVFYIWAALIVVAVPYGVVKQLHAAKLMQPAPVSKHLYAMQNTR